MSDRYTPPLSSAFPKMRLLFLHACSTTIIVLAIMSAAVSTVLPTSVSADDSSSARSRKIIKRGPAGGDQPSISWTPVRPNSNNPASKSSRVSTNPTRNSSPNVRSVVFEPPVLSDPLPELIPTGEAIPIEQAKPQNKKPPNSQSNPSDPANAKNGRSVIQGDVVDDPFYQSGIGMERYEIGDSGIVLDEYDHPQRHFTNGARHGSPQCRCEQCRPISSQVWARVEYLFWSLDNSPLPSLVTQSPIGTPPANVGILGTNSTVLFGGDEVNDGFRSGGRATVGIWADPDRSVGWEVSYLRLDDDSESFGVSSSQFANLGRPIFDTATGAEAASIVAAQGILSGSVDIKSSNEFQLADFLARRQVSRSRYDQLDWVVGYRFADLNDRLRIDQTSRYLIAQGPIPAGTEQTLFDSFETQNQFHGVQFGFNHARSGRSWTLATHAQIGLGVNRAEVEINGSTLTTVPGGGSATFDGGLLAQPSNMGKVRETEFAYLPEVGITWAGRLSPSLRLLVGYRVLYWSNVARAADQIDRRVSQLPPEPITGTANPRLDFETTGLLIHGLNAGLQLDF